MQIKESAEWFSGQRTAGRSGIAGLSLKESGAILCN